MLSGEEYSAEVRVLESQFLDGCDILGHGSGPLFPAFVSDVLVAIRDVDRRPLRRLVRGPEVGGSFRSGGNVAGTRVPQGLLGALAPLRSVAVHGQENAAAPDSSRVALGDVLG